MDYSSYFLREFNLDGMIMGNFGSGGNTDSKAWKDIWGSGQGIGLIEDSPSVEELVGRLKSEYELAFEEFKSKIK